MAVTLTGAGGLFTILKKVFGALEAINTQQGTTTPSDIDAIIDEMGDNNTADGAELIKRLVDANASYERLSTMHSALKSYARDLIIDRVHADNAAIPKRITDAIDELIRQMESSSDTVERNVVSATVSTDPGAAAPQLLVSETGGDGRTLQQLLPETIVGNYRSATSLKLTSGPRENNRLLPAWPKGSGISKTLSVLTAADSLLANASFDSSADRADTPDDWIIATGVIGTTINLTAVEVQTVTINGGPSSGHFTLTHTRSDGFIQTTTPLAHDASAADVQSALQALVGLEDVTVTLATNVYTITFTGVAPAGDQSLLSSSNNFDTGSIAHAESTAGEPAELSRAMAFLGNGAELTTVRQPLHGLSLAPNTVYAFSLQCRKTTGATGTLVIELVEGDGSTVIADDEGTNNTTSVDVSTLSDTGFAAQTVFFRTPKTLPAIFYLQLRLSTAVSATDALYMDEAILTKAVQLYRHGPYAAAVASDRDAQSGDRWVITNTNDQAGRIQTWFSRLFERQLPSATSGAETIADT